MLSGEKSFSISLQQQEEAEKFLFAHVVAYPGGIADIELDGLSRIVCQ